MDFDASGIVSVAMIERHWGWDDETARQVIGKCPEVAQMTQMASKIKLAGRFREDFELF